MDGKEYQANIQHPRLVCIIDRIAQGEKVNLAEVDLPSTPLLFARMIGNYS